MTRPEISPNKLQIVLASGLEDAGARASIALGIALAAASRGWETHLFLSLGASVLACPKTGEGIVPRGSNDSLEEMLSTFASLGGRLIVCAACYREYCKHLPQRADGAGALLREGVPVESLSSVVERAKSMATLSF